MGEKIIVRPIGKGLRNDTSAFNIDNDSFPFLENAYQWRGRIKRKRGTDLLCRLQRFIGTTDGSGNLTVTITRSPAAIISGISTFVVGTDVFVDPGGASPVTLLTNSSGSATLNRTTAVLTITGSQATTQVIYFPTLPVMGLEDLILGVNQFPGTIGFDTIYSYNIPPTIPSTPYDVSFYKNPTVDPAGNAMPAYIRKGIWSTTVWNGQNYQQFWTTNYQGALWATNGITIPFDSSKISMQFRTLSSVAITAVGPPATVTVNLTAHKLVVGDFLFFNEIQGITGLNYQTGYVIAIIDADNASVELPNATLGGAYTSGGIIQYLTSNVPFPGKDSLRWYDGDPTAASPPTPTSSLGWVNFSPPLSQSIFSIDDETAAVYYLVGARMIVPFKDRLLFLGPVIQTSTGSPVYLQDTIIYSQNGTPYYTCSYTNTPNAAIDTPTSPTNIFRALLVPDKQTATPSAYFEDSTGFGGFVSAGIDQPLTTVSSNEDVLICGFDRLQTRIIYSGNDIIPFNFYLINSELGSSSTFSIINMDKGVLTRGNRGYIITSQVDCQRIDLEIPDQVFEMVLSNNGTERFTAQRDFINEWVYFTYLSNDDNQDYVFPDQTLQFNYRDNSWAIFNESYTTYGQFRAATGLTWNTIGFTSWNDWTDSWDSGQSTLFQPEVIGGNQQGFVLRRAVGTNEGTSISIQNISGSTISSPNHGLNEGDYIIISGVLGTLGSQVNGKIFSVSSPSTNIFSLNPSITGGSYQGGGLITRMYVPYIQTKQFPVAWDMARKTRIGTQQYLLTTTANAQITLLIFLSQNSTTAYNDNIFNPNDSLIYSTILYTCPESTNLGLTAFNTNLQMIADPQTGISPQEQIWHRINTSLIGDTIQLGFTLSDTQMRTLDDNGLPISQFAEIILHSFILDVSPSQVLA